MGTTATNADAGAFFRLELFAPRGKPGTVFGALWKRFRCVDSTGKVHMLRTKRLRAWVARHPQYITLEYDAAGDPIIVAIVPVNDLLAGL